jgi:hypothetical protein
MPKDGTGMTQVSDSPGRLSDAGCFQRAQERGQATFTVVAQDKSAPRVICEWIKENIETCPPAKLFEALSRAIVMRDYHFRRAAD